MDQTAAQLAITMLLTEIRQELEGAASTAKAAEAGNIEQGVRVVLDVEQAAYEAGRLLDAASLINRLSKEE